MNKTVIDVGVGAGAISMPWLTTATGIGELVIVTLGVGLVIIRLLIAIRDYRSKHPPQ